VYLLPLFFRLQRGQAEKKRKKRLCTRDSKSSNLIEKFISPPTLVDSTHSSAAPMEEEASMSDCDVKISRVVSPGSKMDSDIIADMTGVKTITVVHVDSQNSAHVDNDNSAHVDSVNSALVDNGRSAENQDENQSNDNSENQSDSHGNSADDSDSDSSDDDLLPAVSFGSRKETDDIEKEVCKNRKVSTGIVSNKNPVYQHKPNESNKSFSKESVNNVWSSENTNAKENRFKDQESVDACAGLQKFRFRKRKMPNFSDTDSDSSVPDKKSARTTEPLPTIVSDNEMELDQVDTDPKSEEKSGSKLTLNRKQSTKISISKDQIVESENMKFTKRNQMKLSKCFFSDRDDKVQPKLSFFMKKGKVNANTDDKENSPEYTIDLDFVMDEEPAPRIKNERDLEIKEQLKEIK